MVPSRDKLEGGFDLPALSETGRIFEREHKGQVGERPAPLPSRSERVSGYCIWQRVSIGQS